MIISTKGYTQNITVSKDERNKTEALDPAEGCIRQF